MNYENFVKKKEREHWTCEKYLKKMVIKIIEKYIVYQPVAKHTCDHRFKFRDNLMWDWLS